MRRPNVIMITKKVGIMSNNNLLIRQADKRGLANRLWQFSYFIAFAREHNSIIVNPSIHDFVNYFDGTKNNLFCSFPSLYLKIWEYWIRILFRSIVLS